MFKNYQQLKIIILALVLVGGGWYYLSPTQKVEAQLGGVNLQQIIQSIGSVANINLSNFNSVSQLSQVLQQAGSGNQTVGKISDFLDQFGDLGGSISDLTSGNLRSIGDVVNSVGQISDLAGASDILGSLGNLGATADDLLGGNGAWSGVSDMLGSLNTGAGLGNLGTVADNLDTVWTNGGSYNSMILRLQENGSDLGNIIEDPKVLSEDITPDDLLPGGGTGTGGGAGTGGNGTGQGGSNRQNPSEDSKKAEQQLQKDRKEDEKKCKAEKYKKDDLLDPKKLGGVGGGQYVPVQEQDGDLMSYTKDTNKLTGEIKDLQIQICTHLKTIKRIQLKFEEKEFVGDVKAKERAANNLAKFQKETLQNRSEGRTRADNTDGGSFTPTPEDYAKEMADNAEKVAVNKIKNSGNAFADPVTKFLAKEKEREANVLTSSLSKEQYDQLTDPEKATKLDNETLWAYIIKAVQPNNNPVGSAVLAKEKILAARAGAQKVALTELQAGGGYAPQVKAKEKDDEGNVTKREIVSPGSTIARTVEEATLIDTVQNEQADEASDLSGVEQPSSQESTTLEPADGGPSNGGQSPGGGGFDWSTITDLVGDWGSGSGSGGGNGGGTGGTGGGFGNILELLQNLLGNLGGNSSNNNTGGGSGGSTTNKPETAIAINGPTLAELAAGRPNIINIRWGSLNASRCVATNDWLSASLIPNRVEAVKTLNTSVGTSGSLVMYLPLNFDIKLLRERNGITSTIGYSTTTNPALSQQVTTVTLNPSDIAVGDKFILVAQTGVNEQVQVAIQTNVASASAVNTLLNAALDSLSDSSTEGKEFRKYQFFFTVNQNGVGFITITAKASYSIRCSGSNQTADAVVNLTR